MAPPRISILIVDDAEDDFRNLTDLLQGEESSPYSLTWMRDYSEALQKLVEARFEVVIVGYQRGGGRVAAGIELLKQLKSRYQDLPIILLTGEVEAGAARAAELTGATILERARLDQVQLERSIGYALRYAEATRALHQSQRQLEMFMRQVPCAICICDHRGRLYFQNSLAAANFSSADLCRWLQPGGRLPDLHVSGNRHWLLSSFPMTGDNGVELIGIAGTDVSAQVKSEADARDTARLLSAILENLSVMAGRLAPDGTIVEMRGLGLAEVGLVETRMVGHNIFEYFPSVRPHFEQARSGTPAAFVWEAEHLGRRLCFENYLHADTERGGVLSLAINVTARVEAEAESNRQSRLLNNVMRRTPVIVGQLDSEGRVLVVQGEGMRHPGFRPSDLIGRVFTEVHPASRTAIEQALRGEEVNCTLEGTADGANWYVDLYVGSYPGGGATFFCRDLTDRRWLEHSLLTATDREQRRIGADLHDGLGQTLTGLACLATALREQLRGDAPTAECADVVARLANESIQQARALAHGLCPVELEQSGLIGALTELANQTEQLSGISCRFVADACPLACDHEASVHLYRITQEAITNAVRHGGARTIEIKLTLGDHAMHTLTIVDDGRGFVFDAGGSKRGSGLQLMQFRATMLGGKLAIDSAPGRGTRISCHFANAAVAGAGSGRG
ncbi:MAG TPA: ATP-binding protein [Candidatus Didemnitutus sp.]|nr:ATP-binding protein [Candidatus Didemnitutus sp.]